MIPQRFAPILFGLILSGMMSFVVSGISTWRAMGLLPGFVAIWMGAWLTAWLFAFPVAVLVVPFVRRVVQGMVAE